MESLAGRTAVIAGNSRSIGPAIIRALFKEDVNFVLAASSVHDIKQMLSAVPSVSTRVVAVTVDFCDQNAITSLVERAASEFGSIDILVNNSVLETFYPYHRLPFEEIDRPLRISLTAAMLLTAAVLPFMMEQQRGHIVNICSLAGKTGPPCSEVYAAANAGLIAFTKSLRLEYQDLGISASAICPGFIDTTIYRELRDAINLEARRFSITSLDQVAESVVKAIKRDIPEIVVSSRLARFLTMLAEVSPRTGEHVLKILGVAEWFRRAGDAIIRKKNTMP